MADRHDPCAPIRPRGRRPDGSGVRAPQAGDDTGGLREACTELLPPIPRPEQMSPGEVRERQGYEVFGRVQGVGFRWSTTQNARELGLRGTVRNRDDGAVEVHVEGPAEAVRELEDWLQDGPRAARVDEVRKIPAHDDLPDRFQILR